MFRLLSHVSLSVACVLLYVTEVSATTYYVRTTGNDANNGTASWTAFRTIKKAASVAKNGDIVSVGSGTYSDAFDIVGVQNSSVMLEFLAEYPSSTVISGQVRVINSNNIVFNGFRFEGAAERPMSWSGSYDGRLYYCQFSSGAEAILVQDGSLTIDRCEFLNFTHDGLQVDGETLVHLTQSTISGCQENGIEIRKAARVVLDGSTLRDNLGDGIRVAITADEIDDGGNGGSPGGSKGRLVGAADSFDVGSGVVDAYDSSLGAYSPANPADAEIFSNGAVKLGSVPLRGNVWHGPGASVDVDNLTGSINQLDQEVVLAPIDPGDAATNNNNANIPLSDDGRTVVDSGGKMTIADGDGVTLPPGTYYLSEISMSGSAQLRTSGPTVIYITSKIGMSGGSFVNPTQVPGDLKLMVTGSTISMSGSAALHAAIYAPDASVNLSGSNEIFGMMVAKKISSSADGGFHADLSLTDFANAITGGALVGEPSSPQPPLDWQAITSGELVISSSTLSGNTNAVNLVDHHSFATRDTDFSSNREWGLQLRGTSRVENCTISNNATGGVWLNNVATADLTVSSNTVADNTEYGLYAETCDLAIDSTNIADWAISGSNELFLVNGGSLTMDGVNVSGGTTAGVHAYNNATLTVRNAAFQNNGYGIAADNSTVVVDNSTLSQNTVGLYSNQNTLVVRNSSLHSNSLWGAAVYPDTLLGTTATFENTAIHSNLGGLTLVNGSDGDLLLRMGTVIRDNTDAGLHFESCTLTLNDQAGGTNWRTLRNGYGIKCHLGTLDLADVLIEESSIYGVRCEGSDVTLTGCNISGKSGIYADAANVSLTVKACKLEEAAGTSGGWGLFRGGGNLTVSDSLFAGFDDGVYLYTAGSLDQANVLNATIANVTAHGVYLAAGDATVKNTILHGNGASYGLSQAGGQLTHSHNLIDGFSTPYNGTSADSTELLKKPRFVDGVAGDFHLAKGSPAINSGTDLGILFPTDLEGNSRPSFKMFEIGAYEYTSPNGGLRVLDWRETR